MVFSESHFCPKATQEGTGSIPSPRPDGRGPSLAWTSPRADGSFYEGRRFVPRAVSGEWTVFRKILGKPLTREVSERMFLFWSKQKTCPGAVTSQCGRARPETPSLRAASVPLLTSTSFLLCAAFPTHLTRAWLNYQHPWRPQAQQDSFRKIYFTFLVTLNVSVILIEPM